MITNSASWVLDTGCGAHIYNDLQMLKRSRKLGSGDMILKFGNGKAISAEAVGSTTLVARSHIPRQDEKIDKGRLATGLLDLIHTNICGPLRTQARGGFSYFITFTDNHSRYGYVYLMRYKPETPERFKELRVEVENQTNCNIKVLRSDRGGEYLSTVFLDYLKENGIISEWTPPGSPQLNSVSERRNRTLLDMVRSMMSFTNLPLSFWGYALETTAKLLNLAPTSVLTQTTYEIWHDKPATYNYLKVFVSRNAVFLEQGFPEDTQPDELILEESSDGNQSSEVAADSSLRGFRINTRRTDQPREVQHARHEGQPQEGPAPVPEPPFPIQSAPTVTTDVPVLRRSTRESRPPVRYGFLNTTGILDNDPKTYGEVMSDIDSGKWLEAMKTEIDAMSENQVWRLVDPPKGVKPVDC
ncbi:Retrovirus-related Pol polyprotein from transposon TNT 1-94 [Sesamum alatum]|uniref:Retrovirus-related Pol polyprotein from transposon TNT 1-94 n=1 Tax=Sesamum alatum TaxID=300844 RepID=A0AAE1XY89_9LAMI|nr:Retrovirus-related Pol polyprotein from transposon TNT 1-94 [Sesamum alatum]